MATSGTITISPVKTTTYTITASNPGGNTKTTAQVTVVCPPTVAINANAITIQPAGTSVLSWSSTDSVSCVIEPGIGSAEPSGSIQITLSETMNYTITAIDPLGTAKKSVIIAGANGSVKDVLGLKNYVRTSGAPDKYSETFSAATGTGKITVYNSDSRGKFWISSANISLNGVQIFGPALDTSVYQLEKQVTFTQQNTLSFEIVKGVKNGYLSAYITQVAPPAATNNASKESVYKGETVELTWSSTNANSCSIIPRNGSIGTNGSRAVKPTISYQFLCQISITQDRVIYPSDFL